MLCFENIPIKTPTIANTIGTNPKLKKFIPKPNNETVESGVAPSKSSNRDVATPAKKNIPQFLALYLLTLILSPFLLIFHIIKRSF